MHGEDSRRSRGSLTSRSQLTANGDEPPKAGGIAIIAAASTRLTRPSRCRRSRTTRRGCRIHSWSASHDSVDLCPRAISAGRIRPLRVRRSRVQVTINAVVPRGWNNCPRPLATNQSDRFERANRAARSECDPTRPLVANRAGGFVTRSYEERILSSFSCRCPIRSQRDGEATSMSESASPPSA